MIIKFKCNGILVKPEIKYYNGYVVNAFDISVKNSVSNMKKILAIRSDYANKDILKII